MIEVEEVELVASEHIKVPLSSSQWEKTKLGEIADFIGGGTPDKKNQSFWNGNIPWASVKDIKGKYLTQTQDFISEEGLKASSTRLALPGDLILITRISPGKASVTRIEAAINQDLKIVKPKGEVDTTYLLYLFESLEKEIIKRSSGTTVLGIRLEALKEIEVLLPPLSEQQAIVAKIEELFSALDKGKQQLEEVRQQLKVYRQAVLKWAFEGKLTNGTVCEGKLSEGWEWSLLKDAAKKIQIGPFGSQLHKEDYVEGGIPLVNPMHIQDGQIVADYSYSITEEKRDSLPNYILKEGDIVMGRRGEMGRCGLVSKKEENWFCGTGSLFIRPNASISFSRYLYHYLRSEGVKKYLEENAGGTTMANLNLKIVSNIPLALPSFDEQQLIVQEIESRLSICDKMEETIEQSLLQAETLRQSILKRAFKGML